MMIAEDIPRVSGFQAAFAASPHLEKQKSLEDEKLLNRITPENSLAKPLFRI